MVREQPGSARLWIPEKTTFPALAAAVQTCQGCELYKMATQAVFGEGSRKAAVVIVGEQPGDQEDRAGRPFVGPAGNCWTVP
jgi:uracil-DNA glycosylase